jgi:AcrR family transcriptional regulator
MPRRRKANPTQTPAAPYALIASDIRRRIASGEFAAGARVPSTRQLVKQWNVALATAVKALASLQHEGLIRALPRVGNVVTGDVRPEPIGESNALTAERIVAASIALADAEGLQALSMRAVAAKLGVPTMSLYSHVQDKQALSLRMIERAMAEIHLPERAPSDWRSGLERSARTQWQLFRRHPWLAQVITLTRPLALPNMMLHAEWALRSLAGLGLDSAKMLGLHIILFSYVRGLAINLESEAQAQAETGMDEQTWSDSQGAAFAALAATGRYPTFAQILSELAPGYDFDLDAIFELGLEPMLDGFGRFIERHSTKARPPARG